MPETAKPEPSLRTMVRASGETEHPLAQKGKGEGTESGRGFRG